MRIGVNSDLNIPVRRSTQKHNLGSRAVKLPHSGVETQDSGAGAKLRTKEKQVVKSRTKEKQVSKSNSGAGAKHRTRETRDSETRESSDSEAGAKLRTKTVFNFARDQFECFDYCRRRVSLVSFQMTFNLL